MWNYALYRWQNKLTCKLLKVWEGRRIQSCRWWTGCRTLPVSSRFVWMSPTGSNLDCQVWEQNHSQKSNYFDGIFFSDFVCTIHLTIENEMWHQIVTNVKMWNQIVLANKSTQDARILNWQSKIYSYFSFFDWDA